MSLLEKAGILHNILNKLKKSILSINRLDLFIVIAIIILVITPLFAYVSFRMEAASKQVKLYVSPHYEKLFGKVLMETLIQQYAEINPELKIQIGYIGDTQMAELDILVFDDGDFNALVSSGALLELNSYTNYDSGTRQLAIPVVSFMNMLFYNKEILEAAGFVRPPKTRDEFIAYARTVSRGESGASGAALSLSPNDHLAMYRDIFSWIWASGGNFWTGEEKPSLSSRTIMNDITFLGQLNRDGILAPEIFETTGDQRIEQFAQGKIALMIASTQAIPYLRKKMGDDVFGITTIPDAVNGTQYNINLSSIYIGINSNSAHPDEAWGFLEFLVQKSYLFSAELNAVPGTSLNIIPGDYVSEDPFYSLAWYIFENSFIVEDFSGKPGAEQYEAIFMEELQAFFDGSRSAQQMINTIQSRWDEVEFETTDSNVNEES